MTAINIGGTLSYTISLDSLDLAYLGKYVSTPRPEKMPLWTKKRLDGESEYCQVEIVTRGNNNKACYSESSDTYQCHICNINVPKIFYQKHNESEQHDTLKKIYQKVLERVSKQMEVNPMNTDEDIANDSYYCEPCSKIIKNGNKIKHESTEYHAKSVQHLTIINEFYKIFNKNISNDINEDLVEEENDHFYQNNNNDIYDESMEASIIDSDDDSFEEEAILPPVPGHSIIGTVNQIPEVEKKQSFGEYLKEMIKKYNVKVTPPVVDGEFVTIVSSNGNKVKVSREHFHGYKEITKSMYCQLCNMWIPENARAHDISEKHVRNIFRPISDKFARTVDTLSSHCIPCNLVVMTDSKYHYDSDTHKNIIKETLTPKTGKTLCKDCNLYIDTHNYSVHLNSNKHIIVLMKQNSIQHSGNNDIFCKICIRTLPKHQLKLHIGSKQHLTKKTKKSTVLSNTNNHTTVNNNASTQINNENNPSLATGVTKDEFCELCKVRVPYGGMETHVNGKPHRSVIAQLSVTNNNDIKPNENKIEVDPKPSTSSNTGNTYSNHRIIDTVASTSSMSSLSLDCNSTEHEDDKIDAYYAMTEFVDENKTKVRCKICSVIINFVEINIVEHMEGKNHAANKKQLDEYNKKKLEGYNKLLFYADIEKTKMKCQICDVSISDSDRNVIEHMEGKNHVFAENNLLKFHTITRDSSEFICECCGIRTTDYTEHINSKQHTLEFIKEYDFDRKEMRKYVYEDDVNNYSARLFRVLYRNLLQHNGIYKLDDVYHFCCMCQIKLSRISEIDHALGERHRSEMEKVSELSSLIERIDLTDYIT